MKISKSIEQGIYVTLMLALQKNHTPVKSLVLSQRLEVSDSYLKKILRKLVVADIIDSNASKDGGYTLKRSVATITFFDIAQAVDNLGDMQFPDLHLAEKVFPGNDAHIQKSKTIAGDVLEEAQTNFNTVLKQYPLSLLLEENAYQNGLIDWQA